MATASSSPPGNSATRRRRDGKTSSAAPRRNRSIRTAILLATALSALGVLWLSAGDAPPGESPEVAEAPTVEGFSKAPTVVSADKVITDFRSNPVTLDELLALPVDALDQVDIARMNLLSASGLRATEGLDIEHALSVVDDWAHRVKFETQRHLYRVTDPRYAEHYGQSEPQFRAEMLAQVLQEDLGVKYDPKAIGNFSFADPSVAFIHGMIPSPGQSVDETPGGTCASMPILYVAVGRRLGYPLKLVTTDSHIFVRWDGLGAEVEKPTWRERFNVETTNGFHRYDDDYYRQWPRPLTEAEIVRNGHLKSLDPAEEFAAFLAARGHHAADVGQHGFAARCYENAWRYDGARPAYQSWFVDAAMRCGYEPATPALASLLHRRKQTYPHLPSHNRPTRWIQRPVQVAGPTNSAHDSTASANDATLPVRSPPDVVTFEPLENHR